MDVMTDTANLDEKTAALVRAGAEALIERGREEVREQWRRSIAVEQHLDQLGASAAPSLEEMSDVTPTWLLREALRRARNRGDAAHCALWPAGGGFVCVALGLTPAAMSELRDVFTRITRPRQ